MFKITKSLAAFAVANLGLNPDLTSDIDANRDEIITCVTKGLTEGKLSAAKLAELQAEEGVTKSKGEELLTKAVSDAVAAAMAPLNSTLAGLGDVIKSFKPNATDPAGVTGHATSPGDAGGSDPSPGAKAYQVAAAAGAGSGTTGDVRLKCVSEQF